MFHVLRIRDFRLLWTAGTISSLGTWLLVLAVPAHVFLVTKSLAATGFTLAAEYLPPLVLGPVAGTLADRWDRRRLMITADLSRVIVVAAMLLALAPGRYWIFYAALAAESGATVLFQPALQARIPAIVGTGQDLSGANSVSALSGGVVRLVGGPAGGILLAAIGITWLIAADAVSYLASAAAIGMTSRIPGITPGRDRSALRSVARDLRAGLKVLGSRPAARALFPVTVIFLAANASLSAVLIPFGVEYLGGSRPTGLMLAALGAGYLLGAPALRVLLDRVQPRYLLAATLAATAVGYWLLFGSSSLRTALPAAAAVGMSGSMSLVISQTTVQRVIPSAALGRVTAVFLAGEAVATLAGAAVGPVLAQATGLGGVAAVASIGTIGAAVLACWRLPPVVSGTADSASSGRVAAWPSGRGGEAAGGEHETAC